MDTLKPFDDICYPDSRQKAFILYNRETGVSRERTLHDHYQSISDVVLNEVVPDKIREHFETARNLFLYSWYVYRFGPVAELHAIATVEFALKEKSGKEKGGLKRLIDLAIKKGWVLDSGFKYYPVIKERLTEYTTADSYRPNTITDDPDSVDLQAYCKILADSLPYLRNELAHGSQMLYPSGTATLAICADVINQLFNLAPHDSA